MQTHWSQHIGMDSASGFTVVLGTQIRVLSVLEVLYGKNNNVESVQFHFPTLTPEQINACIAWANRKTA